MIRGRGSGACRYGVFVLVHRSLGKQKLHTLSWRLALRLLRSIVRHRCSLFFLLKKHVDNDWNQCTVRTNDSIISPQDLLCDCLVISEPFVGTSCLYQPGQVAGWYSELMIVSCQVSRTSAWCCTRQSPMFPLHIRLPSILSSTSLDFTVWNGPPGR
jgi:hypothetical protein